MKKIFKVFLLFLILIVPILSLAEVKNNTLVSEKEVKIDFKGPSGKPFVKGPTSLPPSNEEILAMRGIKIEEKGIFQKI